MVSLEQNPFAKPFEFSGAHTHGILMIHGFTATPGTLRPMGESLAKQTGFLVKGILLPGHGTTAEDMAKTRWYDWLSAAEQALQEMLASCEKVSVVGLSMGGTLTLLLSEKYPIASAVAIAPALSVYDRRSRYARFLWPLFPFTPETESRPKENFLNEYNCSYRKTPVRCAGDLNILMRKARKGVSHIQCPLLLVKAGQDETVRPEKMDLISRKSPYPVETLVLSESPHVCTLGPERLFLFEKAAEFLLAYKTAERNFT